MEGNTALCSKFSFFVVCFVFFRNGHGRTGMNVCYDKKIAVLYFCIEDEPRL